MAGTNPQLAIRISANTAELKKHLAEGRQAIEALGPSVQKMAADWNAHGAKVIQNANNITAALQGINLGTLTAADSSKILKSLDTALDQLKRSGQPIPPLMQETADKIRALKPPSEDAGNALSGLMAKAKSLAGTLGIAFGGAAVVSGLKSMAGNAIEYASAINNVAQKTDVSIAATQRWKFAAEQNGATLDQVTTSVINLSKGLGGGEKSVKESLDAAGLSFDKIRAMKPEDAFNATLAAIEKIPDPMTQTRVATELLGKSGAELLPAIRSGFIKAGEGATIMSDATIKALASAQDKWAEMENRITVATGGIIGKILGMMEKVAPAMQLMFALTGQNDIADMWGIWAKGADKASDSVRTLTDEQKKYVDALVKTRGAAEVAAMDPLFAAYLKGAHATSSYTAELAKTKAALAALSPEVVANFKAADQLGAKNEDLAKIIGLSEGAVTLLKDRLRAAEQQMKSSGSEAKRFNDELKSLGERYANLVKSGVPMDEIIARLGKDVLTARDRAQELGLGLGVISVSLNDVAKQYAITTALQKADQEAAKLTPAIVAANVKATSDWLSARNKAEDAALAKARATVASILELHLTESEKKVRAADAWQQKTLQDLEILKTKEPETYRYITERISEEYRDRVNMAKDFAQKTVSAFGSSLTNLPAVIIGAIQGGGSVAKAIATSLGSALIGAVGELKNLAGGAIDNFTSGLNDLINKGLSSFATKVGGGFAAKMAQSISSALPAIGALIGPALASLGGKLLGAVGGFFGGIFGKNQGREDATAFAEKFGGFAKLRQEMLKLGAEGDRLWIQLTQNTKGPAQVAATIKQIEDAFAAAEKKTADMNAQLATMRGRLAELQAQSEPTWKDMEAAANELGISLEKLGPAFQQAKLTDEATKAWNAIDTLRRGGEDLGGVVLQSKDKLNAMFQEAQRLGLALPENFKQAADIMLANGELIDANGEKLQSLAGLNFGPAVKSQWEMIVDEIHELNLSIAALVETLGGKLVGAVDDVAKKFKDLPSEWDFDVKANFGFVGNKGNIYSDVTPMAKGGSGIVTGPRLFMAGEAGPERFSFTPLGQGSGGGSATLNFAGANFYVRQESDIDDIADRIIDRWEQRGARG